MNRFILFNNAAIKAICGGASKGRRANDGQARTAEVMYGIAAMTAALFLLVTTL